MTCVCLWSLGVYGDVMRVKILFNKKENALIQMSDGTQAQLGNYQTPPLSTEHISINSINVLFKVQSHHGNQGGPDGQYNGHKMQYSFGVSVSNIIYYIFEIYSLNRLAFIRSFSPFLSCLTSINQCII